MPHWALCLVFIKLLWNDQYDKKYCTKLIFARLSVISTVQVFCWVQAVQLWNRPTLAVTDNHMLCVNFTWLGTNIFQLQLELYTCISALEEVSQIPFFVYFCMLIDPTFMKV